MKRLMEEIVIRVQVGVAAKLVAGNKLVIVPSETVYSIAMNGYNRGVVEAAMQVKKKPKTDRPGIIEPPSKTAQFIDYQVFADLHGRSVEQMNRVVNALYQITPMGLIVPVVRDALPEHLIARHKRFDIPTALFVWNNRYKPWVWFTEATAKYLHVLDVGTSVNEHQKGSLTPRQARRLFGDLIAGAIEDPLIARHPHPGSYPHYDMLTGEITRLGYLEARHQTIIDKIRSVLWLH